MPHIFMILVAFVFFCILAFSIFMFYRNEEVYKYRIYLLEEVSDICKKKINDLELDNWEWRYEMLMSVSYDDMFLKFWKPLDSFYPDKSFLDPNATGPKKSQ